MTYFDSQCTSFYTLALHIVRYMLSTAAAVLWVTVWYISPLLPIVRVKRGIFVRLHDYSICSLFVHSFQRDAMIPEHAYSASQPFSSIH